MFLLPHDWFQKQTPSIITGQKASSWKRKVTDNQDKIYRKPSTPRKFANHGEIISQKSNAHSKLFELHWNINAIRPADRSKTVVQVTPRAFNFIQQIFKISNMLNLFMLKSKVQVGNNADKECIGFFKEVKPIATLRFKSNFERNRKMSSTDESELRAVLNLLRVAC